MNKNIGVGLDGMSIVCGRFDVYKTLDDYNADDIMYTVFVLQDGNDGSVFVSPTTSVRDGTLACKKIGCSRVAAVSIAKRTIASTIRAMEMLFHYHDYTA